MANTGWTAAEAVPGGGGLGGGVLPVAMVGRAIAGDGATRATGMANTGDDWILGGGGRAGGVLLAGGTRLSKAGLAGAGEMAAAIANGKSAIAAGGGDDGERGAYGNGDPPTSNWRRTWGSSPDSRHRLIGRCLRGAWVLQSILLLISLIRRTTISKSVPGIGEHMICSSSSLIL